jgi:hypothetical protein
MSHRKSHDKTTFTSMLKRADVKFEEYVTRERDATPRQAVTIARNYPLGPGDAAIVFMFDPDGKLIDIGLE